jgi:hypothetical protein
VRQGLLRRHRCSRRCLPACRLPACLSLPQGPQQPAPTSAMQMSGLWFVTYSALIQGLKDDVKEKKVGRHDNQVAHP